MYQPRMSCKHTIMMTIFVVAVAYISLSVEFAKATNLPRPGSFFNMHFTALGQTCCGIKFTIPCIFHAQTIFNCSWQLLLALFHHPLHLWAQPIPLLLVKPAVHYFTSSWPYSMSDLFQLLLATCCGPISPSPLHKACDYFTAPDQLLWHYFTSLGIFYSNYFLSWHPAVAPISTILFNCSMTIFTTGYKPPTEFHLTLSLAIYQPIKLL